MTLVEIIVIILVVIFLLSVVGSAVFNKNKKQKKCNGNCTGCSGCDVYSKIVERYRKDYPKK